MGEGGGDKSAQKEQIRANQETLALIERQAQQATRDVGRLFGSAQENLLAGNQAGLNIFGQTIPQQFGAVQQGNVGAQQALLAGLPQQTNALLGLPVDLSGLQPRSINVDTSFAQQQLPQFTTSQQALALTPQEILAQEQVIPPEELRRIEDQAEADRIAANRFTIDRRRNRELRERGK